MAFGSKVDQVIHRLAFKHRLDRFGVADVCLHKAIARVLVYAFQVFQVAGIGQLVHIDDANVLVLFHHIQDKVGADKPCSSCDQIGFHW